MDEGDLDTSVRENIYRIDIGTYGAISVEAPSKEECLELFKAVTRTRKESKIDDATKVIV